jgi:hypothetical protein
MPRGVDPIASVHGVDILAAGKPSTVLVRDGYGNPISITESGA